MTLVERMLDLATAELKASRIVRKWPNMALSKQYQLRAVALYLLYRRSRPRAEDFWIGKYRADYSGVSATDLAKPDGELDTLFRNSTAV